MQLHALTQRLGYSDSRTYLQTGDGRLESAVDFGHVFRKAQGDKCKLRGVYTLNPDPDRRNPTCVPIVYVCEADTEQAADNVHRLVWNQDVAPFVLVVTPRGIKLYSGFHYRHDANGTGAGVLRKLTEFNEISDLVESLGAVGDVACGSGAFLVQCYRRLLSSISDVNCFGNQTGPSDIAVTTDNSRSNC